MLERDHSGVPATRPLLALVALALFAPILAHANSISHTKHFVQAQDDSLLTYDNTDGAAGVQTSGGPFVLQNSEVTSFDGKSFTGSLNFTTGNFIASSGSLANGGEFAGGGSFTIKSGGVTVFSGSFSGDVQWIANGKNPNTGQYTYTLTGPITGTYMGQTVTGATTQLTFTVGSSPYTGGFGRTIIKDTGGVTSFPAAVPEPGTLGLMGTGFLGIGAMLRKRKASRS
jgi:hypothetical protein